MRKMFSFFTAFLLLFNGVLIFAKTPECVTKLMQADFMKNADFSLLIKDINSGEIIYDYNINGNMTPASVLKIATTAAALELFGDDYRYKTSLQYDGEIKNDVLNGNIYINGSGDPTLGSKHFDPKANFLSEWTEAIKKLGIKKITGSIISDESIFDYQGINPKWEFEDLGLGYAAGSYGINIFDNSYELNLKSGEVGTKPVLVSAFPEVELDFINNIIVSDRPTCVTVFGIPFSNKRYLSGSMLPNSSCKIYGDIPDPALYLSNLLKKHLENIGIEIGIPSTCSRILTQSGKRLVSKERITIVETYSPKMSEIVKVTNTLSCNLFADALLKTIGNLYLKTEETLTSFGKGISVLTSLWKSKGIDCTLILYDGSGLAPVNKVNAVFISEILQYMATKSVYSRVFYDSLPSVGQQGTVKNLLHNTCLKGTARLKSGSMSNVRCFAGYIDAKLVDAEKNNFDGRYIIVIFANNYHCNDRKINEEIEKIFLNLFSTC